ncbi:VOC family protein [Geodermatophilus sp. URMC 63]
MTRNSFHQVAWVVDDLESAMQQWLTTTSVGPFYVISHSQLENLRYRGKPAELDMSAALGQIGPMQIELIQQHNDGPSVYRDSVPAGQSAMHHIGGLTDDFDAEMKRYRDAGVEAACEASFGDLRIAYLDTRSTIGCMTELIERLSSSEGMISMVADAHRDWDGSDPIRYL